MPVVRLEDVFQREVYLSYQPLPSTERLNWLNSGVATPQPNLLSAIQSGGGPIVTMPYWKPIDRTLQPNMSDDNPERLAVPNKISMGSMQARAAYLNQGFSSADMVQELTGENPLQQVRNMIGRYWDNVWQRRIIATALGIMAGNIAKNGGDMVIDKSAASIALTGPSNLFNKNNFLAAAFSMGDRSSEMTTILVHSVVYQSMVTNNEIVPISEGSMIVPTYYGKRVIVDDDAPVLPGTTDGFKYVSVLFGRGAIGFANSTHGIPVELERAPRAGNGGGVSSLWERKTQLIHPLGFHWTNQDITAPEISPTEADLRDPDNWNRIYPRKSVPMAFLITNG